MKNPKIVKVVGSLVVVGGILVGSFACSQKIKNQHNESTDGTTQGVTDSILSPEITTDANGNIVTMPEGILGTETEKDFIYDPMDFSKLEETTQTGSTDTEINEGTTVPENPNATPYDKLLNERDFYYKHLVEVVQSSDSQTEDDIAIAIYSVVRLDNDLSNLLVKMYKERIKEIEDMKYYADQIEALEDVLNKMRDLELKVKEAEDLYQTCFSKLKRADREQIQKVRKYTLMPLKTPIEELELKVDDLKVLLEEALAAQAQD